MSEGPKFSIITPTIMRVTADRTMQSVDSQTSADFEHMVIIDGPGLPEPPARWTSPRRRFLCCPVRHNDCGATCRNAAVWDATGEYVLYLDDDDYYVPDTIETLGRLVSGEPFGVFPITMGGSRWMVLPPGSCRTASCQLYHRRVIDGEVIAMPSQQKNYSDESAWAGTMAERFGHRVLECHELVVVERGHNSSNLPGGPPRIELPQLVP